MNAAKIHLILNHFPFILLLVGFCLMAYAIFSRHKIVANIALVIIISSWLLTIPTFLSGERAEKFIEKQYPEVSHKIIHDHEEEAEKAIWFMHLTGILALISFVLNYRHYTKIRLIYIFLLLSSLVTLLFIAQVNHSGGKIRHPELIDK